MQSAPRSRTRDVEPAWKRILEDNVCFLQENLLLTDSVFAALIQERILTQEMVDKIKNSSDSDHGRTIELVRCLKRRSDECFGKFLDVLHSTENTFVADRLEQSMQPPSSRQSYSSDETEMMLQAKDRQIHVLEEKLAAKTQRIKELESVNEKLKVRLGKSHVMLNDEMRISDHYKNLTEALNDKLRSVSQMEEKMKQEIEEKDAHVQEVKEKVEELEQRIESLEEQLEVVTEDLRIKDDQLTIVLEKERRIKKKLGLDENATDHEIMEQLQRTIHSRSDMKRAQDQLSNVTREKLDLNGRIATLIHEKESLQFDIRQKELEMKQMRRKNLDSAIPTTRRNMPYTRTDIGPREEIITISRIDVNRYPKLPDSVANMPRMTTRPKMSTARVPSAAAHNNHLPRLPRGSTFLNYDERETKYCVICRRNYYLKNECRIHNEPIRGGKFTCCGADVNSQYVGCKIVNHMYIYFTGIGNEYVFYDERGRQLDFKEHGK